MTRRWMIVNCKLMMGVVPAGRGRKLPPELPAGPERQQEAGHRDHGSAAAAAAAGDRRVHDLQRGHGGLVQRQPAPAVGGGERELDDGGVQGGELDGACAAAAAAGFAGTGEEDAAAAPGVGGQSPRARWVRLTDPARRSIGLAAQQNLHHFAGRLNSFACLQG